MPANNLTPVQSDQRIPILDILRGWALLGVVLMNYLDFYYLGNGAGTAKPGPFSIGLLTGSNYIFAAKSWTLLSVLFGYGFSMLIGKLKERSIHPISFFSRRMFWLLILAVINSAFFFGDILKDYAILGMVLLLFTRSSAKTAFWSSLLLFLAIPFVTAWVLDAGSSRQDPLLPYYSLYRSSSLLKVFWFGWIGTIRTQVLDLFYAVPVHQVMFCCFLLGMAAQKMNFFQLLQNNKKIIKKIFWISLIALAVLYTGIYALGHTNGKKIFVYFSPLYWVVMTSMLLIASALCWLYAAGKCKRFFNALQMIGKMTLTNYIVQNGIGLFLFSGLGLGLGLTHKQAPGYYLLSALIVYIVQVYASRWWLSNFSFGPVEWIWRQLSYGRKLAMKRKTALAEGRHSSFE